jgi:negative regulator of replication initiation
MAQCYGDTPVGTKADKEMSEYLSHRANELGVSKAELLRRLLDHYRDSRGGEFECPDCGCQLVMKL